jgi:hypothetical protein
MYTCIDYLDRRENELNTEKLCPACSALFKERCLEFPSPFHHNTTLLPRCCSAREHEKRLSWKDDSRDREVLI